MDTCDCITHNPNIEAGLRSKEKKIMGKESPEVFLI
jgi:hypothetical protein